MRKRAASAARKASKAAIDEARSTLIVELSRNNLTAQQVQNGSKTTISGQSAMLPGNLA